VRDWNSRVRQGGNASGDSRNNLEWDRRVVECLRFVSTFRENEGVSAGEPDDALAAAGKADEKLLDLTLAHTPPVLPSAADEVELGMPRLPRARRKQRAIHRGIEHYRGGAVDQVAAARGDQAWITRPRSDYVNDAGTECFPVIRVHCFSMLPE